MIEGVISNLKGQGFMSVTKQQEKYKMIISADDINSTDNHFTINNLYLGNNYKPLKAVFKKANGATIERARENHILPC